VQENQGRQGILESNRGLHPGSFGSRIQPRHLSGMHPEALSAILSQTIRKNEEIKQELVHDLPLPK
jgi:hypothetical protein